MPFFTLPIDEEKGPLLNAVVEVSEARAELLRSLGQPIPRRVTVKALVDTGASGTCVDPVVLQQLGVDSKGKTQVLTPSTGANHITVDEYDVSLSVYKTANEVPCKINDLAVIESELNVQGFQVLIGRDFLAKCILHYNGQGRHYTIAF